MSPSRATKTSSPSDKKTFFASPVRFAKPKNFNVIGGGGGGGGGPCCSGVRIVCMGVGMGVGGGGGGSAMRKMFRLLPSYSTLWLAPSRSVRKVGSRGFSLIRGTGPFFWLGEAAAVLCGGRVEAAVVTDSPSHPIDRRALNTTSKATASSPPIHLTFFLFSVPRFTYVVSFKKVSTLICKSTAPPPPCSPFRVTWVISNIKWSRSRALMNFAIFGYSPASVISALTRCRPGSPVSSVL